MRRFIHIFLSVVLLVTSFSTTDNDMYDKYYQQGLEALEAGQPKFMAYLRSKDLTDWEMNYCCLYLVGLNGKEIGEYINLKRHYTYGSVIRHKLGLGEHDKNLANHLKNLIENPPALNS